MKNLIWWFYRGKVREPEVEDEESEEQRVRESTTGQPGNQTD